MKQKYFIATLVVCIIGITTVSAYSFNKHNSYSHIANQIHYSESNCTMPSHYDNGIHTHDTENCTITDHNHNHINSTNHEDSSTHHNRNNKHHN